jgi:hypothetical protein
MAPPGGTLRPSTKSATKEWSSLMAINTGAATTSTSTNKMTRPERRFPLPSRMMLLLVAIIIGWVGNVWNTLAGYSGTVDITVPWLAHHQTAWVAATFGSALNAMGLVALLLAVCVLVRGKGATWATVALATGGLGTFLYAVSAAAPMQVLGLGKQTVITPAQTTSLIDYLSKHDHIQASVAFPGFLLLLVAQIAVAVALFRARVLPLWVPIVFIVGAVLEVVFASGGLLTAVSTVPETAAMVAIGWYAYKKSLAAA